MLDFIWSYESKPLPWILVVVGGSLLSVLVFLVLDSRRAGLSHIPGPFLARYTDLWAVYNAWKGESADGQIRVFRDLQARYGNVIRTGPRSVSVLDPAAISVIYGVRSRLDKGDAYVPFRQPGVTTSLLSIPDEETHGRYRKLVSNAYSLSSIKLYEQHVDELSARLVQVLDVHAQTKTPINLSLWCHYYCFDVVSKLTMGKALGFLEGRDVYSLIERVKAFGKYVTVISHMPWLHKIFQDNPVMRRTKPSPFMNAVRTTVEERLEKGIPDDQDRPDLLAHFIATHQKQSDMDRKQVMISTSGNLIAGGLSPGKTFNEICYFLATNPEAQDKLQRELSNANLKFPASFEKLQQLEYLGGVIKEGVRLHSSTSFKLERLVGTLGLTLPSGVRIPPGTKIGCEAGAVDRDAHVFGEDPDVYRPERWLKMGHETYEDYAERIKTMERTDLSFGQGSRTCIGKNIAMMEIFKAVSTLMAQFKFKPVGTPVRERVMVTVHY